MIGNGLSQLWSVLGSLHDELSNRIADRDLTLTVAGVIFLFATALRLYRLDHESLWLDEILSLDYVTQEYTTLGLIFKLPLNDPHPPLYYLLLDGWVAVFGTSEIAIRLPSAIFGMVSVALIYALGTKLVDREAGIVASALLGFSSFHLYYAQEARMYTLFTALTLASLYFLVDVVELNRGHDRCTVAAYVIMTALMTYTHVFGFFVILAQNLYAFPRLLFAEDLPPDLDAFGIPTASISFVRWISVQTSVAILLGPWMFILLQRMFAISQGGATPISWIPMPGLLALPRAIYFFFFFKVAGDPFSLAFPVGEIWITVWMVLIVAGVGMVVRGDDHAGRLRLGPYPGVLMPTALFLTPLIGAYVVSIAVTPIFVMRYLICASLGLFLLAGAGVSALRAIDPIIHLRITPHQFIPLNGRHIIVAFVVLALVLPLPGYYAEEQKNQWRKAVADVEATASSDAVIVITDGHIASQYRYYSDRPELAIKSMSDSTSENRIGDRLIGYDEVWVLDSDAQGTALSYLRRSTKFRRVESYKYRDNGLRIYKFIRENKGRG